jgi:Rrp15p
MAITAASKKRKVQDGMSGRIQPKKKVRKQTNYHSSEDESDHDGTFAPVDLLESDDEPEKAAKAAKKTNKSASKSTNKTSKQKVIEEEEEEDEEDDLVEENDEPDLDAVDNEDENDDDDLEDEFSLADEDEDEEASGSKTVPKRHDPSAFSTSMSKILSTKLPTSARADPVLSRSKAVAQASSELANERLEQRARSKLRAEKKEEQDRGRDRDVLGIERGEAGQTAEEEKRLRKIAQRGVVKLFNAVRAAQVRGEEAAKAEQKKGTVGIEERKKAANEVSKQSFLELINGKKGKALNIEEA